MLKIASLFVASVVLGSGGFAFSHSRSRAAPSTQPALAAPGGPVAAPIPVGKVCNVHLRHGLAMEFISTRAGTTSYSHEVVHELSGRVVRSDDQWVVVDGDWAERGAQHWIPRDEVKNVDVFPND